MLVIKYCTACQGTGDWRGNYAKNKPDFRAKINNCLHCNGTGLEKKEMNVCKYCGEPCTGYACNSCENEFERERETEVCNEE